MRFAAISVVGLALLASSGGAQQPRTSGVPGSGVVGCYAFFDSAGRPADASLYWAPATARLDSGGRAVKLTPKFDPGRPAGMPGSYRWSVGPRDSLRVDFNSGYSGTEFVFARAGFSDTLRGLAQRQRDSGPPFHNDAGAAIAVRIACPDTAKSGRGEP